MSKQIPIQNLDAVLSFMTTSYFEKGGLSLESVLRLLKEKKEIEVDGDELIKILNQLIDDKYVSAEIRTVNRETGELGGVFELSDIAFYHSTYKGIIFNEQWGYQGLINRQNAEKYQIEALEKAQKSYQNRTMLLTAILAVGTSIAAWYYWLEICHKYHWFGW